MKKLIPFFFSIFVFAYTAHAQESFKCGLPERYKEMLRLHPEIKDVEANLEQFTRNFQEDQMNTRDVSAPSFVIPIVVHIIHNYGSENISDAQVYDAIRQVNADFRKQNADTILTVTSFQSIAADSKIEFRLARIDPNGNCTNGIDRVQSNLTYSGDDDAKLNDWPRDKYLNVWAVNTMADAGVAGYSYYPSSVGSSPEIDGVILLSSYVGAIGTSTTSHAHTLSHEIGHYLNLKHCWGDTNSPGVSCGNDNVNDTPETKGWETCNLSGSTCNVGVIENVQNFMEYSYCSTMFTAGQRTRMQAALNSGTSSRSHLWTTANLIATGTDNLNYIACAPLPNIIPVVQQFVCVGDTVFFGNTTYNSNPTSWDWTFNGGSPAASNDSAPQIIYNTIGNYNVSLTATNAFGSNTVAANNYVTVLPNTGVHPALNLTETFENMTFPGGDWATANTPNASLYWTRVTNVGYSGVASIMINTAGTYTGQVANVITPTYDFTGVTNPTVTFRLAHARKTSTDGDILHIYVSEDCGQTWKLRYNKFGSSLATTTSLSSSPFYPAASDWRLETIGMSLYANEPNVRLRFEYTQKGGNNIYIDDINYNNIVTSDNDISESISAISIFPNPSVDGELAASFNLSQNTPAIIRLVSADGRYTELANTNLNAGHQLLRFETSIFPTGYYTLWIEAGDESYKRSVIIKR